MKILNHAIPPAVKPAMWTRWRVTAPIALAALLMASCTPPTSFSQQDNPSQQEAKGVIYRYVTAQELGQASKDAAIFCNQQQSIPRAKALSVDATGANIAAFDCLRMSPLPTQVPDYNPNLGYNMLSQQELAAATHRAEKYCMTNGSHKLVTNVKTTSNGEKAISFQCATQ